jgi:hypothetical protein
LDYLAGHPVRCWDDRDHGWATRWQLSTGRRGACCDVAVRRYSATRIRFEFPGVNGAEAHGLLDELADIPADRRCPVSVSSTCHEVAGNLTSFDMDGAADQTRRWFKRPTSTGLPATVAQALAARLGTVSESHW